MEALSKKVYFNKSKKSVMLPEIPMLNKSPSFSVGLPNLSPKARENPISSKTKLLKSHKKLRSIPQSTKAASGLSSLMISPSMAQQRELHLPDISRPIFGHNSNSHSIGVGDS